MNTEIEKTEPKTPATGTKLRRSYG